MVLKYRPEALSLLAAVLALAFIGYAKGIDLPPGLDTRLS